MRAALLLVTLALCAGCKRGAKETPAPAPDDRANAKATPVPAPTPQPVAKKDVTEKKPETLKDERPDPRTPPRGKASELPPIPQDGLSDNKRPWVGKDAADLTKPAPGVQPNQPPGVVPVPPAVVPPAPPVARVPDPVAVQPVPPLAPGGNTPRGAAKRLVAMADMRDLQLFIDNASAIDGKMPDAATIMAALREARSPVFGMVQEGSITLTGIRQREGVWAFETAAYLNGGLAVSQNGVERLTADELRKRLGK